MAANRAVYIEPENQEAVDKAWMRAALVMVSVAERKASSALTEFPVARAVH
jgi:hypothetical protein